MIDPSGPDLPAIQCYQVDGCCGPSPCAITQDDFVCQVRSLAPEGDIYNNTQPAVLPTIQNRGAVTVGCAKVGCEQLVLGSCCIEPTIPCVIDDPVAPQLAVIDSFAVSAYGAVQALCAMLLELDPCTAQVTIKCWAQRFNIAYPDPCAATGWSQGLLAFLICLITQLRYNVVNMDFLTELAARFGATFIIRYAGDLNCGPGGWWTLARDAPECPPLTACPPDASVSTRNTPMVLPFQGCYTVQPSLNIILSPANITIPSNCNLPGAGAPVTLPHDAELYSAFKWLLPQLLPATALWCVYDNNQDGDPCIV
jgi:hypothetical protein